MQLENLWMNQIIMTVIKHNSLVCKPVILLFFCFLTLNVNANLHIDTSYDGRYRHTPEFSQILADLPFVYQESFQRINRILGIPPRPQMTVVVVFSDKLLFNGHRLRGMRRSIITSQRKVIHYIHLDLEFIMNGEATLIEEMTHEMTHAIMADIMGLRNYDVLPMWVKEGTAVHAADQGLARIKALTRRGFNIKAFAVEDECLHGNPISLEKYVEHYLKVRFLQERFGKKALHKFVKKLMQTGDVAGELARCFNGLTEEILNQYASNFIKETLNDNSQPISSAENLKRGIRFFEEEEYLSARIVLTEALYGGLTDRQFQKAAYLLAECYIQERNPRQALEMLSRFRPDNKTVHPDRYEFLSAYSKYAMGLISNAYFRFKQAFNTSTNQAVREGSLYYIIRILIELNNHSEALNVLNLMQQEFPDGDYFKLAKRVMGYD